MRHSTDYHFHFSELECYLLLTYSLPAYLHQSYSTQARWGGSDWPDFRRHFCPKYPLFCLFARPLELISTSRNPQNNEEKTNKSPRTIDT